MNNSRNRLSKLFFCLCIFMHPINVSAVEGNSDAIEFADPIETSHNEMESILKRMSSSGYITIFCGHEPWHVDDLVLSGWIEKGLLDNYESLTFNDCEIKRLPDNIRLLTGLKILNIQKSNLESLDNISSLTSLRRLGLRDNKIKVIPDDIGTMLHLKSLNLRNNQIKSIPAQVLKIYREQMVDMDLQDNPLEKSEGIFSTTPESVSEMAWHLDPANPQYNHDFDHILCDPKSDMSVFIKTPGADVEKILEQILIHNAGDLSKEQQVGEQCFKPAAKLLATKLIDKLRNRQQLAFLQSPNTSIGKALGNKTLPERSQENINKLDQALGSLSPDEESIYRHILEMPFYLKHYTQAAHYNQILATDSELKSFKTLAIALPQTMDRDNTPPQDRCLGNIGNVFFRLETSPRHDSHSRFGASIIVMDEDILFEKGWVYFWDLVLSADEKYPQYTCNDQLLRSVTTEGDRDPETGAPSVKDDKITITYPQNSDGPYVFELSISDTFFYGKDIKPGLAKFMVFEIRKMGLTQTILKNPEELKPLYRKLYKVQAMIPGEVKLNPTNHRFFSG